MAAVDVCVGFRVGVDHKYSSGGTIGVCGRRMSSSEDDSGSQEGLADGGFNSKHLGISVQKKVLGKLGTKNTIKVFIDDNVAALLDNVFQLCKDYSKNKKEAEKLMKNMIKITIKIGILYRNNQFNEQELALADSFRKKFRTLIMTFTSFCTVDFSYDKTFLAKLINDCCSMLTQLVTRHLTEKSINRITSVFKFFSDDNFLDTIFEKDCPLQKHVDPIVKGLERLIENDEI